MLASVSYKDVCNTIAPLDDEHRAQSTRALGPSRTIYWCRWDKRLSPRSREPTRFQQQSLGLTAQLYLPIHPGALGIQMQQIHADLWEKEEELEGLFSDRFSSQSRIISETNAAKGDTAASWASGLRFVSNHVNFQSGRSRASASVYVVAALRCAEPALQSQVSTRLSDPQQVPRYGIAQFSMQVRVSLTLRSHGCLILFESYRC